MTPAMHTCHSAADLIEAARFVGYLPTAAELAVAAPPEDRERLREVITEIVNLKRAGRNGPARTAAKHATPTFAPLPQTALGLAAEDPAELAAIIRGAATPDDPEHPAV